MHILGDILNSIGVIVSSLIIYLTDNKAWFMDPICTFLFTIIVFYTTRITFMHCINMLMECTPLEISTDAIKKEISKIKGVRSVHDLHVWSLSDGKNAITMHLVCT